MIRTSGALRESAYPRHSRVIPPKKPQGTRRLGVLIFSVVMIILIGAVNADTIWTTYAYRATGHQFTQDEAKTRLVKIFNEDRNTYGVESVHLDSELSNRSYYRALDVRDYNVSEDKFYTREDIFVVSQAEFGRSYYFGPVAVIDRLRNTDYRFRLNELNRDNTMVGIGVVEGNGNFYVVVRWE